MRKNYIVTTWETVQATYEIEATSETDARNQFERAVKDKRIPEEAEQQDYMAFDVDVRSVDLGPPPSYPPCQKHGNIHYFNKLDEDGYRLEEAKLEDGDLCECGERRWSWDAYNRQMRFQ